MLEVSFIHGIKNVEFKIRFEYFAQNFTEISNNWWLPVISVTPQKVSPVDDLRYKIFLLASMGHATWKSYQDFIQQSNIQTKGEMAVNVEN